MPDNTNPDGTRKARPPASDLAPETVNDEQEDSSAQAQTVAQEAMGGSMTGLGLEDSEKAKGGIADEDDVQDLVDHMRQMESSGRIDMSAYRGEDNMDDVEDRYGEDAKLDKDLPGES